MKGWDIIGYAYNAAMHCPDCAHAAGMDREDAIDGEGNGVAAAFASGEDWQDECCDDCGAPLDPDAEVWSEGISDGDE